MNVNQQESSGGEQEYSGERNKGTATFLTTISNGLNALSGVGILSIPYALSSGGWLSLMLLFIIAIGMCYTGILMKRCLDVDERIKTYPDIGDTAFGKKGRLLVSIFVYVELYLVATGFLITAGDNLHNLFPRVNIRIFGGKKTFILYVALIMLPTVWTNSITILSYISAFGVLASIIVLGSIIWGGTDQDVGFHQKGRLWNWTGIPTALSLYSFCYGAHPIFPTLYTSMKNPKQFSLVLLLCFMFCTITYASMAICGYLMFGSKAQSLITLNLSTGKISSKVAIYTSLVNPLAKYALVLRPIVDAIQNPFPTTFGRKTYNFFVKTSLVGSSAIVAMCLPFFGELMSLVGAFLNVMVAILLPCVCYLKIYGVSGRPRFELVFNVFVVLAGFVILITGTYTSLVEIIKKL